MAAHALLIDICLTALIEGLDASLNDALGSGPASEHGRQNPPILMTCSI
jgi:hypothetical protein